MSKEKDKILRTLEHIAITFDKLGYSPTIPICTGHKDFEYLFRLELGTIKELCNQQDQRIVELEEQLKKFESIEKEIGCDIEVFWKVYRKISGHGNIEDLSLYTITDENEIIKIMPTEIISGTYSNYPQDCSFKYWIWDNVKGCYKHSYTYFHFHDYKRYWFLTKEEAQAKLEELKGE